MRWARAAALVGVSILVVSIIAVVSTGSADSPATAGPTARASGAAGEAVDARSEEQYRLHCSGCHGLDRMGTPGVTPSLRDLAVLSRSEAGRSYVARVPGVAQAPLSDADLTALLDWLVGRVSESGPRARFTVAEVARARTRPLRDPLAARRRLPEEAGAGLEPAGDLLAPAAAGSGPPRPSR